MSEPSDWWIAKVASVRQASNELNAKIDRLFRENVRRREAIEAHARAMREEGIKTYEFDRVLHRVVGIDERPTHWREP